MQKKAKQTVPFVKGQSGNPSGMPRIVHDVRIAAKQHTRKAVNTLVRALGAKDCPWSAKIQAAQILLDRGHGRAIQAVDHGAGGPVRVEVVHKIVDPVHGGELLPVPLPNGHGDTLEHNDISSLDDNDT